MRSKVVVAGVVAAIVLIGAGIWVFSSQKAAAPNPTTNTNTSSTQPTENDTEDGTPPANNQQTAALTITYTDNGFDKSSYTVKKGQTVKVVNNASSTLQFSSDNHPTHQLDPELNLDSIAPGKSATFTPTTIGSHGVHDHLMANHTTTLVVTE